MNKIQLLLRAGFCAAATFGIALSSPVLAQDADAQINDVTAGDQRQVDVSAAAGTGDVIYVWTSETIGGSGDTSIQARRFDATNAPLDLQFQASATDSVEQFQPAVAAFDDGGFVAVWASSDGTNSSILGRLFSASDAPTPLAGDLSISAPTTGVQSRPSVAFLSQASFVVVWSSPTDGGSIQASIRSRSDGAEITSLQVDTSSAGIQDAPSVARRADGGFVVVWASEDSTNALGAALDDQETSIQARLFDSNGNPVSVGGDANDFQVNTSIAGVQDTPSVIGEADGGFIAVWASESSTNSRGATLDAQGFSIQARRFDAAGAAASGDNEDGNDFQVNTYVFADQLCPDVAVASNGVFRVSWDSLGSAGSDASLHSIQSRLFDAAALPDGDDTQVNRFTRLQQIVPALAYNEFALKFESAWESRGSAGSDQSGYSIPEPGSASLGLGGLATLAFLIRRRPRAA
jgi:hypothetical protein